MVSRSHLFISNYLVHRDMPTFFVVLDACGEVVDFLKLKNFLKRKNSYWGSEKFDKVCILMFSPLCKINDLATQ